MIRSLRPHAATAGALALAVLTVSGCGSAVSGSLGSTSSSNPARTGSQVFTSSGCGGCHIMAAAGSTGNVGPNLDSLKPSYAAVFNQVRNGGGGMPSFKSQLSQAQIESVAHYVVSATQGGSGG